MLRWILLALGSIVFAPGHGAAKLFSVIVVFALAALICYRISLDRHPRAVCRTCGGSGRHKAAMFWWADRACTSCAGSSRHRRRGVQVVFPDRSTWAERRAQLARRRRSAPR